MVLEKRSDKFGGLQRPVVEPVKGLWVFFPGRTHSDFHFNNDQSLGLWEQCASYEGRGFFDYKKTCIIALPKKYSCQETLLFKLKMEAKEQGQGQRKTAVMGRECVTPIYAALA